MVKFLNVKMNEISEDISEHIVLLLHVTEISIFTKLIYPVMNFSSISSCHYHCCLQMVNESNNWFELTYFHLFLIDSR